MNAQEMLVRNVVNITFKDLPKDAVEATKKQVLDTLGTTVAGSRSNKMDQLANLIKEWGGKEESTIVVYGGKVPAPNAALVNGTLSCVLDYDDIHDLDGLHGSRAIVPAGFAIAERVCGVSGKDFIAAVAVGFDLAARLSRATMLHFELGWDPSATFNFFGAAATVSKILGLDELRTTYALGIAYEQTCGPSLGVVEGALTKGLSGGLAARGGVIAAILGEKGFTSGPDFLEGKKGFFNTFHRGLYKPALLTLDLGKVFEGVTNSQKPYPCCRFLHTSIDAVLALVNEYDINSEEIVEVLLYLGQFAYSLCEPLELKQNPQNAIQAQFSLPWAVANAILYRKVGIEHFIGQAIQDASVRQMARRIVPKLMTELSTKQVAEPVILEMKLKSGKVYSKRVDSALGSPQKPLSFDEITRKFRDCCAYAKKDIPEESVSRVIQMVGQLEEVTDVAEIIGLLN